ncbi:hypothetical protein ID866_10847 [Astraeus odoratus]|nr:hypothetical protein ID866_10847 [Astraeus odoratus]
MGRCRAEGLRGEAVGCSSTALRDSGGTPAGC